MFQISYSANLKWEVEISASKNAALPIVSANYILDNAINIKNKPNIADVEILDEIATNALKISKDYFDLTSPKATKIRASILLIPLGLLKYGEVKFVWTWGCAIGKRPLDSFDEWLRKAWIEIEDDGEFKTYKITSKPKKNIMFPEFSVTATEALITYLAFAKDVDYDITVYQCATEPHVQNLIKFLNNTGADITISTDHTIIIKPTKQNLPLSSEERSGEALEKDFYITSDYIEAGTYFAIGAGADNSELTIKNCDVDDLSSMYSIAEQMGINFKIIDKHTIIVNSYNKANYKPPHKFQTRIYPWFPTDLQSIFWALFTQCNGISKIYETIYEWRFGYLTELENLWANIELLNPHQALVIWPTALEGGYVSSTDLRWWWAMVLAGIMAKWTTNIMAEDIILRWYDSIMTKLQKIWVDIKRINDK